jgi:uncharacterized protein (TIGR04255 family)
MFPHLNSPPVVEALLNFQASAVERWTQPGVEEIAKSLFPDFYPAGALHTIRVEIPQEEIAPSRFQRADSIEGYMLKSSTTPIVHQVRRDGYSLSWMKPYKDWESLVAAGLEGWGKYQHAFVPAELHQISVRFLNHLVFPLSEFQARPQDFLTIAPHAPNGRWLPGRFSHSLSLGVPDSPWLAHIQLHLLDEAGSSSSAVIMLDIELQSACTFNETGLSLEEALTQMRQVKNQVFFGSLTNRVINSFQVLPQE